MTALAPAIDGSVLNLTGLINAGVTVNQRIGDWIRMINIHGNISVKGTDGTGQIVAVRCFIVQWHESAEQGDPLISDFVNNDTAPTGQFNFDNKGQFKILWTKLFNIVNQDNNPAYQRLIKFYVRCQSRPKTLYAGVLPKKFHYFFCIFSDTDAPGEIPTFRLDLVSRYTDS